MDQALGGPCGFGSPEVPALALPSSGGHRPSDARIYGSVTGRMSHGWPRGRPRRGSLEGARPWRRDPTLNRRRVGRRGRRVRDRACSDPGLTEIAWSLATTPCLQFRLHGRRSARASTGSTQTALSRLVDSHDFWAATTTRAGAASPAASRCPPPQDDGRGRAAPPPHCSAAATGSTYFPLPRAARTCPGSPEMDRLADRASSRGRWGRDGRANPGARTLGSRQHGADGAPRRRGRSSRWGGRRLRQPAERLG